MHAENSSLVRIISRSVEQARQDGLDQLGQMERAVKSVLSVEPDLTDSADRKLVASLLS